MERKYEAFHESIIYREHIKANQLGIGSKKLCDLITKRDFKRTSEFLQAIYCLSPISVFVN